ncbi:MAG TPA: DISARM system SNF2-like helicase DrmD [Candidatus Aminicenantes bacterium]|nr:DISARM system SNF2-like helicase DrmD [Candidatus Aminicenantes bacterium]
MFATVRNRRGVIVNVEPHDGDRGRVHLVHIEYKDDQLPSSERLLWEIEPRKTVLEPTTLPPTSSDPMPAEDYDALLRAARWTAASPFLDPDGSGPLERLPITSPFHGAIQIEDYQLVPLLKALRMPRVSLLIADDVGLGKTIEAGLILSELLLRRRIQRVLILTPASLRVQWRDEMWERFSLRFDLIDRGETYSLRKQLGMDVNPWRSSNRIIASYHYLRQDEVLEQFCAASRQTEGTPRFPWDLLIVDECHNLMPLPLGGESDLCRMLRIVAPLFEHRIFLSATPHNGHTYSFTGLLEILDPVRFSRTDEIRPAERERIQQVVIRRLKREINARTDPPMFCTRRPPQAIPLDLSPQEIALSEAFDEFRAAIRRQMVQSGRQRSRAGSFAVEILGKRLLSCPTAFAESWRRCREGLSEDRPATEADVDAVRRAVERDTGDDCEAQSREATAVRVVGSWLRTIQASLSAEIAAIDRSLNELGYEMSGAGIIEQNPNADSRFKALADLIRALLFSDSAWRDDERLVVFTEYKTTLDYLVRRLREHFDADRIRMLYGGMEEADREAVKQAFNDPADPVRILLATDAASEGINLQQTARYLLHFDCPWNPSKLEQRNGRLDRHGQARDVTVHHFVSDTNQDLRFLAHVISKANDIREDLGSANELFDEATHRRLVLGENASRVQTDLDNRIAAARGRAAFIADTTAETKAGGSAAAVQLQALAAELDLTPSALRRTLETALAIRAGRPQLEPGPKPGTWKILRPDLPGWCEVIDEALRRVSPRGAQGSVLRLAFDPGPLLEDVGGRRVFRQLPDISLMHLSHPLIQRALNSLTRRRFPGGPDEVSRWTVRLGEIPADADALILLSLEELAVNDLREAFHHWVSTVAFPIRTGKLSRPLPHLAAQSLNHSRPTRDQKDIAYARDILDDNEKALRSHISEYAAWLTTTLRRELEAFGVAARREEDERYRSRQGEISSLIVENTLAKLERDISRLKEERRQGFLYEAGELLDAIDRSIEEKEAELARRRSHYEEVRQQLESERERILKYLLPHRFTMTGSAQVFPVSLEIRLPGGER